MLTMDILGVPVDHSHLSLTGPKIEALGTAIVIFSNGLNDKDRTVVET